MLMEPLLENAGLIVSNNHHAAIMTPLSSSRSTNSTTLSLRHRHNFTLASLDQAPELGIDQALEAITPHFNHYFNQNDHHYTHDRNGFHTQVIVPPSPSPSPTMSNHFQTPLSMASGLGLGFANTATTSLARVVVPLSQYFTQHNSNPKPSPAHKLTSTTTHTPNETNGKRVHLRGEADRISLEQRAIRDTEFFAKSRIVTGGISVSPIPHGKLAE
jgi:hypothetical protein